MSRTDLTPSTKHTLFPRKTERGGRLARLEKRGGLDLTLALLALAQWGLFPHPVPAAGYFHQYLMRQGRFGALPIVLAATWVILVLGALAPALRRPAPAPGALPRGAGLWLAGYALMAGAWFMILFNNDPDNLFGFWHLARLAPGEGVGLAIVLPLALAPGWRRAWRAARWGWVRRRVRKGRKPDDGHGHAFKPQFSRLGRALLPALAGGYAWLLTDVAIMSDGFGIISFAGGRAPLEPTGYREPGTMLLLQRAAWGLKPLGLDAAQAIHFVNFCAMLGVLALVGWLLRLLDLSRAQRGAGWWLILSSLGVTQMLLGRVELYPLVELSLTATVACAVATVTRGLSPAWLALAFALGLAGHLSLIFVLPAVLAALWFRGRPARAAAQLLGWGALIHLPLWGWLMSKLEDPTPRGLVRAVLGSLNTGAVGAAEAHTRRLSWLGKFADCFRPANDFKLIQLLFYLAGGALLTAALILLARLGRAWRAVGRPDRHWGRQMAVLAAALLGYLFYAFTWPNDWSWTEDWDLFSGLAPLAALLTARWLMPARAAWRLPPALVRQLCLFALALSLTQHYFYHRQATWLNAQGKVVLDAPEGRLIQQYQLRHGWHRFHEYRVRDGQVLETEGRSRQ